MKITSINTEANYLIQIDGDLDASSAILLDQEFEKGLKLDPKKILVDCSLLNYISSAGLGVFMSYLQDLEDRNIILVIFNLSQKVFNVFSILGLDSLLKIVETKEEALNI